jgi:dihydrolipoamide dehydrogenase
MLLIVAHPNVAHPNVAHCCPSTGRRPYLDNLGLDNVGIKLNEKGQVDVNDHFQTNVPSIYAIGDCIPGEICPTRSVRHALA